MRSFKRNVLPVLILVVLLLLVNYYGKYAGELLKDDAAIIDEYKRAKGIKEDFNLMPGKTNVMVFGSSEIFAGFNPLLFDSLLDNKTHSINMGLLGLPVNAWYFALKRFIDLKKVPQYVIIDLGTNWNVLDRYFEAAAAEGASINELWSFLIHNKNKTFALNYLLPAHKQGKLAITLPYYLLSNPQHIDSIKVHREVVLNKIKLARGFMVYSEKSLPNNYFNPKDTPGKNLELYDFSNEYYTANFFSLCEKNKIKILITNTPKRIGTFLQYQSVPTEISSLTNKYKTSKLLDGWKINYYPNEMFCDQYHLNKRGSIQLTHEIAKKFKQAVEINNNL